MSKKSWRRDKFLYFSAIGAGFLIFIVLSCTPFSVSTPLKVMSFNIRYDNPNDGANVWENRKDLVTSTILFHKVDICGMQEVLDNQLQDLIQNMPGFEWIGVGRDDGEKKGEYAPIFFRISRLKLLEEGHFWLSETPDIAGSMGWDAACTRIVTWGRFKDEVTAAEFYVFNTHFDHVGQTAREKSAQLLVEKVNAVASSFPVIVTGDFNCNKTNKAFALLTSEADGGPFLQDTHGLSQNGHYGGTQTYNGFREILQPDSIIDFIFIRNTGPVLQHAIIADRWDGRFVSDHYPVYAEVKIK